MSPRDKRALFVSLLEEVRRFPLDRAPELRLANRLAKEMAAALLPKQEDFLSAGPEPSDSPIRPAPVAALCLAPCTKGGIP